MLAITNLASAKRAEVNGLKMRLQFFILVLLQLISQNSSLPGKRYEASPQIYGGEQIEIYEYGTYSFYVRIMELWVEENKLYSKQLCGGALLSDRVVVTAASCIYEQDSVDSNVLKPRQTSRLRIRTGEFSYSKMSSYSPRQELTPWRLVVLKGFDANHFSKAYDLGFLEIQKDVKFKLDRLQQPLTPCSFDFSDSHPQNSGYMLESVGMGKTSNYEPPWRLLQKITLEEKYGGQKNECISTMDDADKFENSSCFAASGNFRSKVPGFCDGDVGNPVFATDRSNAQCLYAVNIQARVGDDCDKSGSPIIAIRLHPFYEWGVMAWVNDSAKEPDPDIFKFIILNFEDKENETETPEEFEPEHMPQHHEELEDTGETPKEPEETGEYPEEPEHVEEYPEQPDETGETPKEPEETGEYPEEPEHIEEYPKEPEGIEETPEEPEETGEYPEAPEHIEEYPKEPEGIEETPEEPEETGEYPEESTDADDKSARALGKLDVGGKLPPWMKK